MKQIENLTLMQKPAQFKKEDGQTIDYMEYSLLIAGRKVLIKPVNGEAKVRLMDAFEDISGDPLTDDD